ncbi:hypothetical protein CYMTET_36002 [Cymbomonas tetramitiformis]|uniref:Uncharacterized protein n=1 Tax=Cymbomonas tetramitiformis TaxID=36881 RepID=A0AAE0F840_9CHLO|nr:hypothetical protein CYMTET_36002 [Cymbomonas tetramitiformis]
MNPGSLDVFVPTRHAGLRTRIHGSQVASRAHMQAPECEGCSGLYGYAATTPVTFGIQVQGSEGIVSNLTCISGAFLQPAITMVSLDFYGAPVASLHTVYVSVKMAPGSPDSCGLSGATEVRYQEYFQTLIVTEDPGRRCMLRFTATNLLWDDVDLDVGIALCEPGAALP